MAIHQTNLKQEVNQSINNAQPQGSFEKTLSTAKAILSGVAQAIRNTGPQSAYLQMLKERAINSGAACFSKYIESISASELFNKFRQSEFGDASKAYASAAKDKLKEANLDKIA